MMLGSDRLSDILECCSWLASLACGCRYAMSLDCKQLVPAAMPCRVCTCQEVHTVCKGFAGFPGVESCSTCEVVPGPIFAGVCLNPVLPILSYTESGMCEGGQPSSLHRAAKRAAESDGALCLPDGCPNPLTPPPPPAPRLHTMNRWTIIPENLHFPKSRPGESWRQRLALCMGLFRAKKQTYICLAYTASISFQILVGH